MSNKTWTTENLPDSDMVVLMRLESEEYPVWPGSHDGEEWLGVDGASVEGRVLGWIELEDAAFTLDMCKRV